MAWRSAGSGWWRAVLLAGPVLALVGCQARETLSIPANVPTGEEWLWEVSMIAQASQ
jgi:hypothetical protein